MNKREFAQEVALLSQDVPEGGLAKIDPALVEAVYQIVLQLVEIVNNCMPDATDEEILQAIRRPTDLQQAILTNVLKKYFGKLFEQFGPMILKAILDMLLNLSPEDIRTLRV